MRQANDAVRQLDDVISDLERRKPAGFKELVTEAERLKVALPGAAEVKAFAELEQQAAQRLQIIRLTAEGRETEAEALQIIWAKERELKPLSEERRAQVLAIVEAEKKVTEQYRQRQALTSAYLDATRSVRSELESFFAGEGADFGKIAKRLQAQIIVESLFGDAFRQLEAQIETGGLQSSVDTLSAQTSRAGKSTWSASA